MRACYDSFEWVGVGSRWLEAAVGRHTCDGMGATPHFLDHRTGEVVADGYRQRSDQAPNLDAEVVVETLCPGLRRTVTRSGSARPFQAERGFGISPWDSQERRGTLRLQRCNRSPLRVAHCRDGCYSVQLGKRFLTWLDRERGVHAYSLAGGEVTRWMVPDAHSVAHTRKRIFVLSGRNHRVRSARLPRPAS
jgi:hypothetical protein